MKYIFKYFFFFFFFFFFLNSNEDQKELEEIPQKEGIMLELDMAIKAKVELTRELTKISKE